MITLRRILRPLYKQRHTHSVLRTLVPVQYRQYVRRWFQPDREEQWCRVVMNREIEKFISSLNCGYMDVLEISGSGSQGRYNFKSYQTVAFPDYDVCKGPLAAERFDLVIAEQVFEHVLRPDRAASNVYQMLRPQGIFVVSTPFLVKLHEVPVDLYRWTEHGIRQLLETAGFSILNTSSWGNLDCLFADMTADDSWTLYDPARHHLENDPRFAIVVWAFAQKGELQNGNT